MATSPETLAQVRDLLRKMDRSIDDARDRRLAEDRPAAPVNNTPQTPAPAADDPAAKPGRARPLAPRPDWQSPKPDRWTRPA